MPVTDLCAGTRLKALLGRCVAALAASLLFASQPTVAAPHACERTTVFYVNGVWNWTLAEAEDSARFIRTVLGAKGVEDAGMLRIRTVWNPGSVVGDLEEVGIDHSQLLETLARDARDDPSVQLLAAALGKELARPDANAERRRVIEQIKAELLKVLQERKTPIVAIAHSQGNIYLNAAVHELQTEDATRNVPGVRNIGVLGLGVAATYESILGIPLHRYVTAQGDAIIDWLLRFFGKPMPPANFLNVKWEERADGDAIGHGIVKTYLSEAHGEIDTLDPNSAMPGRITTIFSDRAAQHFKELRRAVESRWPCASDPSVSPTVMQGEQASFSVKIGARPGDNRRPQGQVAFLVGDNQACVVSIDQDGVASCQGALSSVASGDFDARFAVSLLDDFNFWWTVDPQNDVVGRVRVTPAGPADAQFELRDARDPTILTCWQFYGASGASPVAWSSLTGDYEHCFRDVAPEIRCTGSGCTPNRFQVTTTSFETTSVYEDITSQFYAGIGNCPEPRTTVVHSSPTTYPGYNWGPVSTSFGTVNPYGILFGYYPYIDHVYFIRNVKNLRFAPFTAPPPSGWGKACVRTAATMTFQVRIYDRSSGAYYVRQVSSSVPWAMSRSLLNP